MSKIALYRKYRPHCFAQVLAQDFVVKTLKHEIINNNLYHAYIFLVLEVRVKHQLQEFLQEH